MTFADRDARQYAQLTGATISFPEEAGLVAGAAVSLIATNAASPTHASERPYPRLRCQESQRPFQQMPPQRRNSCT